MLVVLERGNRVRRVVINRVLRVVDVIREAVVRLSLSGLLRNVVVVRDDDTTCRVSGLTITLVDVGAD